MRLRALVSALVAIAVIAFTGPARLGADTPRDAMLMPVSALAPHLHDPNLVVLEVGTPATYQTGHIPGARAVSMNDFMAPANAASGALTLELPDVATLTGILERFGVSDDSRVVIAESDNYHTQSTRIYLTLVHAGFGSHTSILDGGLPAWKAAGQPTTADVPAARNGSIAHLATVPVTVDAAFVQAHEHAPGFVILDSRRAAAWEGTEPVDTRETPPRFGHVPGSHSLPYELLWDNARSALKPAADLEKAFADAGVKPGDTIVGYCYIGQRATAMLFAAATLGHPVVLYDGSMEEWARLKLPLQMPGRSSR